MNQKTAVQMFFLVGMVSIMFFGSRAGAQAMPLKSHPATDSYDGWRLGVQAYSFRKFTFYEAVDKTASLGLNWIEAYPSQRLSKETGDVKFSEMTPEQMEKCKQKMRESGVKPVVYGVVQLSNDEAECRKVFDFAQKMGMEVIGAEPKEETFDLIEKLCKEYKIKVAIHNHPQPSHYWNPDKVLEVIKGRSKWIGACADTGHWMRSGINPLEGLKKLEGRIISLHFKDLNEFGKRKAHDMIWGKGKGDVKAMLGELHRQGFKGVFSVEYEHNWENSVPEIRECVEYFNKVASELKPTGWKDLLARDLSNCTYREGSWVLEEGTLTRKGGGYIWVKDKYKDFLLDLQFKVAKGTNSGVLMRTGVLTRNWWQSSIEVQILDSYGKEKPSKEDCGAIFDCLAPSKIAAFPPGQWNRLSIGARANRISVVLNGEPIIDMDLNLWTEPHKNPDGTPNKYGNVFKDIVNAGHIGFQDHGQPVWFRNITIKSLDKK